jgi:hypothetical protein
VAIRQEIIWRVTTRMTIARRFSERSWRTMEDKTTSKQVSKYEMDTYTVKTTP